jgi:7-cyano-7-deazaguanine synthase
VKAVTLLSGGLDSAVATAMARSGGRRCIALSFDYGQRHRVELEAARRVARALGVERHVELRIDLRAFGGSALTSEMDVPKDRDLSRETSGRRSQVPTTYVPARNLIFLSCATALAEVEGAEEIVVGVNAIDYSGYPDCRPEFIEAFERAARVATAAGTEGRPLRVAAPLAAMSKADIVRAGMDLGVDFSLTHSCYDPDPEGRACGRCDSCALRRRGFEEAGVPDPTVYVSARS